MRITVGKSLRTTKVQKSRYEVRRISTEKRLGFANRSLVSGQLGEVDGTPPDLAGLRSGHVDAKASHLQGGFRDILKAKDGCTPNVLRG